MLFRKTDNDPDVDALPVREGPKVKKADHKTDLKATNTMNTTNATNTTKIRNKITTPKTLKQEKAYIKKICDETTAPKTLEQEKAVKHEQTIDGGCDYIKLFDCKLDQADMHGESPYNVVFGPDICGPSTKKVLGDTGNECAENYPYYGLSLLELSRLEAGVLKPTLEGSNMDTVIKAKGDRRSPSLPPEGKT